MFRDLVLISFVTWVRGMLEVNGDAVLQKVQLIKG